MLLLVDILNLKTINIIRAAATGSLFCFKWKLSSKGWRLLLYQCEGVRLCQGSRAPPKAVIFIILYGGRKLELNKIWDAFTQCWQVKILASTFITCFTFIFGEINAPLLALGCLMILDTITKLMAISRNKLKDMNVDASIVIGYRLAFRDGLINSRGMREGFYSKMLPYTLMLILVNLVSKIIPEVSVFGYDIAKLPHGFISSFLAIIECKSVIENLIEMGAVKLKPLLCMLDKKTNEMIGGD